VTVRAFGTPATVAWAATLPSEWPVVVTDPSGFGAAFAELVSRGIDGESRDLFVLPENPRSRVLDIAIAALKQQSHSHDALLRGLDVLAGCKLWLNGRPQAEIEQSMLGQAVAFQDLTLVADRTFFRSFLELERASLQYGYRPLRAHVFTPGDASVPAPHAENQERAGSIAVWAVGAPAAMLEIFRAACFDVRAPLEIVTDPADADRALQRASVVVALTENPGTVHALARWSKPLCAPVCGAAEIVENLREFLPWHRVQIADALLVALDGTPARPRALGERGKIPAAERFTPSSHPLVSIVMPTFSRPNTLRESLARLAQQTYPNLEIIVVNNAGTPVLDVVEQFPNARLIDRDVNTGNATRPRNDGIAVARGEYIMFLDDDDVLFADHVERMVWALECSGRDAAYSDFLVRFVDRAEDGSESLWGWDLQKPFGITSYEMLVANRLGYFTVFMRRSLVERIGAFAEEVLGGEEVEYWLRIAKHTDFIHVAQPSSAYTVVRDWRGQLSEKSHALYAGGYEQVYQRYPAEDLPLVRQARAAYVASLRSTIAPPPMQPRYVLSAG